MNLIDKLKGGLIVSCQAYTGEPLFGSNYMERMAVAAYESGAVGIRANGPNDVRAIRRAVPIPIIGIYKISVPGSEVYITPNIDSARVIANEGAEIIALDCTNRPLPDGSYGRDLIHVIKEQLGTFVMADISNLKEGILAEKAGADLVSTTMSGYTQYTVSNNDGPDFKLVEDLTKTVKIPTICEGRIWTREDAIKAFDCGAYAIVIGSAITAPQIITSRFVEAIRKHNK